VCASFGSKPIKLVLLGTWFADRDESDLHNPRKLLSNILESTSKQPPPTEAAQDYTQCQCWCV
jgi:hypothetical protein